MNGPIRKVGLLLIVAFTALLAQLINLQVVQASKLNHDPRNTRQAVSDFARPRGAIQSADGVVLAQSVPSKDVYRYQRQYPTGSLFAFVTGYQSLLYGTDGVEYSYGPELAGRDLPLRLNLLDTTPRTANVTVTLTAALQQVATQALGQRVGAVIALDPATGAVLALVSQPTYDPNPLASHSTTVERRSWDSLNADIGQPLLARAFRERYAPGSTFKIITTSSTLDHEPALAAKNYPVTSSLALPNTTHQLHNFGGESCGGLLPEIFRVSCDTAFGQMGLDLGGHNLTTEALSFGFDARPPLDLPPVAASFFPAEASFLRDQPSLAYSAIGQQDVAATPLQMALAAAAIANHGVIMRPHVMASITDSDGRLVRTYKPAPWINATSAQTAAAVTQLMVGVVNSGTGTGVALPASSGVQVAAKTGTAEVDPQHTNAWMVAFAPADNPRIVVAVVLPGLAGIGNEVTGGVVAAPVVRAVIAAYLGIKL